VRRRGDGRGRRNGHRRVVCRWRGGLHGIARREPAGKQFASGSAGLRTPRSAARHEKSTTPTDLKIPLWQSGKAHNPDEMVVVSTMGRNPALHVGLRGHRGARTSGWRALRSASPTCRRKSRILLEFHRDGRPARVAQHRHGRGIDCALRADAAGKPRLHYNLDFPDANPEWAQRDTVLRNLEKRGWVNSC